MSGLVQYFDSFLASAGDEKADYGASLTTVRSEERALSAVERLPANIDYDGWRKLHNEALQQYMEVRFLDKDDLDEEDVLDSDSNEEEDESQQQETQPDLRHDDSTPQPKKKKRIPNLADTLHHVNLVAHIDLYTKTANIPLARADKIFQARDIRRPANRLVKPQRQPVYQGITPRVPFLPMEEDGPLATCYRKVITIELLQLQLPNILQQQADAINKAKQTQRIRVFFYNAYAAKLDKINFMFIRNLP